jgi:hypothetical protein
MTDVGILGGTNAAAYDLRPTRLGVVLEHGRGRSVETS